MPVKTLSSNQADDVLAVLREAFFDYPVMRHVLGRSEDYAQRLDTLIGFFVAARVFRHDLLLGVSDDGGRLVGVGLVSLPGERPEPDALTARREAVWTQLGTAARARYEAFGAAHAPFAIEAPHHHLNMIGVRPSHVGQGLARTLLDHVHGVAEAHSGSCGVTLSTETARNVGLYEHFGYQCLGHSRVAEDLETWAFFRPRGAGGPGVETRHGTL